MKANPGGNLDPKHVYGRDQVINHLWDQLEQLSVLINAERRIGKTQVLRKMLAEPRRGWTPIYRDLEGLHTAQEFAETVYNDIQKFLGSKKQASNFLKKFLEENETKWGNLKQRSWKQLLTSAVEDLMDSSTNDRLVFFWDEMPYMIENIRKAEGERRAAEVLDTLRSLRVEQSKFRVIYTGSIGLHHVIGQLTENGIPTSPVNDMYALTIEPLEEEDAIKLARDLLVGEKIPCDAIDDAASMIATEVDRFPFYIHHVVAGLKVQNRKATSENILAFVADKLVDASDPWQLSHYRVRIPAYYADDNDRLLVVLILDCLAKLSKSRVLALDEVLAHLEASGCNIDDRERVLRLLRLLDKDHYLARNAKGSYSFKFSIIKRWWVLDRGLA